MPQTPLEAHTRTQINRRLQNLDWELNERKPECNVFQEHAKTDKQNKKLKGDRPDYILYESDTDSPLAVIEAKRPGKTLDGAMVQAERYARAIEAPIIFAFNDTFVTARHIEQNRPLKIDGAELQDFVDQLTTLRFVQDGAEILSAPRGVNFTREQLLEIFKQTNKKLRKDGLRDGYERFSAFAEILFLKLVDESEKLKEHSGEGRTIDTRFCWSSFTKKHTGQELFYFVKDTVWKRMQGEYGDIFSGKLGVKNASTLEEIIEMIDPVQTVLVRKIKNPQYRKHLPVFKAMLQCGECGGTVTWEIQKGHWYAHCSHYRNCTQKKYVRQEAVEEQLFPYFDNVAPKNARLLEWLEDALKESHKEEIKYNTAKRNKLNKIISTADKRIEATYKDKLDGKVSAEMSKKFIDDFTHEKEDAIDELQKLSEARTAYYEAGYAVHELAMKAKEIYLSKKATVDDKRLLLSHVFVNHSLQDSKITPNYTLAFDFLSEWMPKVNAAVAQTKNAAQGDASSKPLRQPHGTARTSLSTDAAVTASEVLVDGLAELRRNNFRTSENPYPISRFSVSDAKSRDLLRLYDEIRTYFVSRSD